jgi:hypothetical protein
MRNRLVRAGLLVVTGGWLAVVAALVGGCGGDLNYSGTALEESKLTEANQRRLTAATPPPQFERSLERENLVARLQALNVANKVGYVYILGDQGQVVAHYAIRGKVSSLNSLLTTPEQFVGVKVQGSYRMEKMPSPDFDGSYGKNPEGIFFFTTDGALVETTLKYVYLDRPMRVTTPVTLHATVDLERPGK